MTQHKANSAAQPEPLSVSVPEAARVLAVSRSQIYCWLQSGRLRSFKAGRRRLIRTAALRELLEQLEAESPHPDEE